MRNVLRVIDLLTQLMYYILDSMMMYFYKYKNNEKLKFMFSRIIFIV